MKYKIEKRYESAIECVTHNVYKSPYKLFGIWEKWEYVDCRKNDDAAKRLITMLKEEIDND